MHPNFFGVEFGKILLSNFKYQANKYLNSLILCDIVRATDPLRSQEAARYRLTERGVNLLKNFDLWQLVLETFRQKVV